MADRSHSKEPSENEEEEDAGMKSAYSIEDMLDALTDSDQDEFQDTIETQAIANIMSQPPIAQNGSDENRDTNSSKTSNQSFPTIEQERKKSDSPKAESISPEKIQGSVEKTSGSENNSPSFRVTNDIGGRFQVEGSTLGSMEAIDEAPSLPESSPPDSSICAANNSSKAGSNNVYENVCEAEGASGEQRHVAAESRDQCVVVSSACSSDDVKPVALSSSSSIDGWSLVKSTISRLKFPVAACSTPINNNPAPELACKVSSIDNELGGTHATDISFTSDISITEQSFQTQAVQGSDPFANLRRINSVKGTCIGKAQPATKVPEIVLSSPHGSQSTVFSTPIHKGLNTGTAQTASQPEQHEKAFPECRGNHVKAIIEQMNESEFPDPRKQLHFNTTGAQEDGSRHFDAGSFELLENDVYEELGKWGEGTAATNDPWVPNQASWLETSGETVGASYEGGLSSTWERSLDASTPIYASVEKKNPLVLTQDTGEAKTFDQNEDAGTYVHLDPQAKNVGSNLTSIGNKVQGNESTHDNDFVSGDSMHDATSSSPTRDLEIYENVSFPSGAATLQSTDTGAGGGEIDGWSSDEFETYETSPANTLEVEPVEQAPPPGKPVVLRMPGVSGRGGKQRGARTSMSPDIQIPQVLSRLGQQLSSKLSSRRDDNTDTDDSMLIQVSLNMEKHPPAQMPPVPLGLNHLQLQRRHVLAAIVESETSYLDALRRLVKDYERPLLDAKPQILAHKAIRTIFYKMNDILQCHNMFHIELTECVKNWDEQEAIGNVFTASFSKAVVFETYSAYVNNFSVAMDVTKKQARSKPAFAEFLKDKINTESKMGTSADKLSLFGLMVKPVQRFPQFIMLLQDLLKYTPLDHHDRLPLQMALTELETLTHRLNDTKRDSESRHDARRILNALTGRHSVRASDTRYLVRQDDAMAMELKDAEMRTKQRRLILFNDLLLCVNVGTKETETGLSERYKYKWSVSVRDCDVIENAVTPQYQVRCGSGQTTVTALKQEKAVLSADNPHKAEVDDMLHDMPVIEQIGQLVGQLRMKYQGLNVSVINGLLRSLQINIQQKSDVNKCVIQLSIPAGKAGGRVRMYFQVDGSDVREDWLLELQNTKLALEPKNNPGWLVPEHELVLHFKQPLFMRPLLIDVTNHDTRVVCALAVTLPSPEVPGAGLQHLWVCSSDPTPGASRGQVTVVSVHGNTPHVTESFRTSEAPIVCAELVPEWGGGEEGELVEDTVWMALNDNTIQVRPVVEEGRRDPVMTCTCAAPITCIRYADGRVYVGLENGQVSIYSRDQNGAWDTETPQTVQMGSTEVTCLISVRDDVLAACGRCVHVISVRAQHDVTMSTHEVGSEAEGCVQCMVQASAGLFVAYKDRPTVRLYHLETMLHLQDVSVSSVIHKLIQGKHLAHEQQETFKNISVTCMTAYKGALWIGTSVGCVLTLPLPRLEGVPQIKVRPSLSYHSHTGPVRFLVPVHCGHQSMQPDIQPITEPYSESYTEPNTEPNTDPGVQSVEIDHVMPQLEGVVGGGEEADYQYTQSEELASSNLSMSRNLFSSTPELRGEAGEDQVTSGGQLAPPEDVRVLYGSLMRLNNEDYDAELLGMRSGAGKRRKVPNIPGLSAVTHRATALNARMSQIVNERIMNKPPPQSRYATLPIVREDGGRGGSVSDLEAAAAESASHHSSDSSTNQEPPMSPAQVQQQYQNGTVNQNQAVTSPPATPTASQAPRQLFIPQTVPVTVLNSTISSKSSLVLSGGQGHINWSAPRNVDLSYDDLCLLMWQHRQ